MILISSEEFGIYLQYVRKLGFEELPDYNFLQELFNKVLRNGGHTDDSVYDWKLLNDGKGWEVSSIFQSFFLLLLANTGLIFGANVSFFPFFSLFRTLICSANGSLIFWHPAPYCRLSKENQNLHRWCLPILIQSDRYPHTPFPLHLVTSYFAHTHMFTSEQTIISIFFFAIPPNIVQSFWHTSFILLSQPRSSIYRHHVNRNTQLLHQSSSQQPLNSALNVPPNAAQHILQHSNSRANRQSRTSATNKEIRQSYVTEQPNVYRASQAMETEAGPKHRQQEAHPKPKRRGFWSAITCGLCSSWTYPVKSFLWLIVIQPGAFFFFQKIKK